MVIAVVGLTLMGFNSIRVGFAPIADLVFFGLGGVLWLLMLTDRSARLAPPDFRRSSARLLVAIIVLLSLATVSSFRSWYPGSSMSVVLRLAYLTVLWFWMLRCLSVDRRAIAMLMRAWRWGVLISCGAAIAANAGIVVLGSTNAENRQSAWFFHPNDLAGFIAVAIPLFLLDAPRSAAAGKRTAGLRWLATLGIAVFALSTTGSMSALLSAAVGVSAAGITLAITRQRAAVIHPLKVMAVGVIAVIGLTVLFSSDVPVVERLTRYEEGDSQVAGSVGERGALNERVVHQLDDLLVLGHGLNPEAQADLRGMGSGIHNLYVKLLYEAGLIAALALIAMLVIMLQQGWRLLINMRSTDVHLDVVAVFGCAVTAMTFALFQPISTQRYFWVPFVVIQCFWTLRRTELHRQASQSQATVPDRAPTGGATRPPARRPGVPSAPA